MSPPKKPGADPVLHPRAETRPSKPPRRSTISEPYWQDEKEDPAPPPRVAPADAIGRLVDMGEPRERAVQYVDLFMEYREATLNIRKYGVVCYDRRTMNAMENPYMGRRDKARQALERFRDIEAPWLWEELAE